MEKIVGAKPLFRDKRRRAWELDFLRGIAVLAMCFDHMMYDLTAYRSWFSNRYDVGENFVDKLSSLALAYWRSSRDYVSGFRFWAHALFIFLFLFLVGTSCAFSRDNTKRGAQIAVASLVFTGISYVCKAMGVMEYGVVFGILQCIAMSVLICAAVDNLTAFDKNINKYAPLVIGAAISVCAISFEAWIRPTFDYEFTSEHFLGYIFGTYAFGDDWFGLYPYIAFVFFGMYWGKAAYPDRASLFPRLDGKWNKPFTFVGRHALIWYFCHQVVIAGLIILIGLCLGFKL